MSTDQELLTLAARYEQAGRLIDAEAVYRQVLTTHPSDATSLHGLGVLALRGGRLEEARRWLEQAIAQDAKSALYFNNYGSALQSLGKFEAAIAAYAESVRIDPSLVIVHYNIGRAKCQLGQWDSAIEHFQRVLAVIPGHAESHLNLGLALARQGETDRAIAVYRAALALLPNYSPLWNNLGNALKVKRDWDGAVAAYGEALRRDPSDALTLNNLGDLSMELGLVEDAIALFRRCIAVKPSLAEAHSNLIFARHLHPDETVETIAEECARWWRLHGAPRQRTPPLSTTDDTPDRRLRVGYMSPDLREHPVGRHLLPVLRAHDASQFEVIVYSDVSLPDGLTAQFRECAAEWRESGCWSDEQLAEQIRSDSVDVLVELSQHSAGNRLRVAARQPAPVQISFAGYPGGTGVETIHWRISDRFLDSPGNPTSAGEDVIRLPDSFWCFDPLGETPPVNSLPALENGFITYGCLGKFSKVNPRVLDLWSEVLRQVPRARLLLLCPVGKTRARVCAKFRQQGIAEERLSFTERLSRAEYFSLYQQLDLMLDPYPYHGHMTTCDALWMGVPVITLAGRTPVSRGGLSLLSNVGLPGLVAYTPDNYVRIAVTLANDYARLAAWRAGLRERMQSSPLMDTERFTRGLESAYRSIWQRSSGRIASVPHPEIAL